MGLGVLDVTGCRIELEDNMASGVFEDTSGGGGSEEAGVLLEVATADGVAEAEVAEGGELDMPPLGELPSS